MIQDWFLQLALYLPPFVVEEAIDLPNAPIDPQAIPATHSVWDLIFSAGPVVKLVMLMLLIMSIMSWGIIVAKWRELMKAKKQTSKFAKIFWTSHNLAQIYEATKNLTASPDAAVYASGHKELISLVRAQDKDKDEDFGKIENVERALKRAKSEEITRLERGTTFLATTASAAPFIGLFGTVWGIMNAFMGLSSVKNTSIQAVAPGISEALIATAIGLAAAIPAAVGYNYFMQQVRVLSRSMDVFSAEFLNIARRHFLK